MEIWHSFYLDTILLAMISLDSTRSENGRVSFGAVHAKFENLPYITLQVKECGRNNQNLAKFSRLESGDWNRPPCMGRNSTVRIVITYHPRKTLR